MDPRRLRATRPPHSYQSNAEGRADGRTDDGREGVLCGGKAACPAVNPASLAFLLACSLCLSSPPHLCLSPPRSTPSTLPSFLPSFIHSVLFLRSRARRDFLVGSASISPPAPRILFSIIPPPFGSSCCWMYFFEYCAASTSQPLPHRGHDFHLSDSCCLQAICTRTFIKSIRRSGSVSVPSTCVVGNLSLEALIFWSGSYVPEFCSKLS